MPWHLKARDCVLARMLCMSSDISRESFDAGKYWFSGRGISKSLQILPAYFIPSLMNMVDGNASCSVSFHTPVLLLTRKERLAHDLLCVVRKRPLSGLFRSVVIIQCTFELYLLRRQFVTGKYNPQLIFNCRPVIKERTDLVTCNPAICPPVRTEDAGL